MGILWTILIGFIAGVLAKLITPGDNEPSGFILTTILGIVGAFVSTPALAVEFEVSEIFVQTPGPGAGARIVPPAEA